MFKKFWDRQKDFWKKSGGQEKKKEAIAIKKATAKHAMEEMNLIECEFDRRGLVIPDFSPERRQQHI